MPRGDTSKEPPPPAFVDDWQLGKPDLVLEMGAGFTVPADGPDIYRNFVLPTGLTEDKWVKAIELKPSARAVVHHVLFASDKIGSGASARADGQRWPAGIPRPRVGVHDSGGDRSAGSALRRPGRLGAGDNAGVSPGGHRDAAAEGFRPDPADAFPSERGIADARRRWSACISDRRRIAQMTQLRRPRFSASAPNIDIPAGAKDYKVRGSFTIPGRCRGGGGLGARALSGQGGEAHRDTAVGRSEDPAVDPRMGFQLAGPVHVSRTCCRCRKGTRLDGELTYDNSADNIRNPNNPPKRVTWGEQSTDEMGSVILSVVPKNSADIDVLRGATFGVRPDACPAGRQPAAVRQLGHGGRRERAAGRGHAGEDRGAVRIADRPGESRAARSSAPTGGWRRILAERRCCSTAQPAPLLYASSGQLAAVVPYSVDGKPGTQVQVKNGTLTSDPVAMPVTPVAPSIFSADYTGSGQGAILNEDGVTVNSRRASRALRGRSSRSLRPARVRRIPAVSTASLRTARRCRSPSCRCRCGSTEKRPRCCIRAPRRDRSPAVPGEREDSRRYSGG